MQCPVSHAVSNEQPPAAPAGKCPFDHGRLPAPASQVSGRESASEQRAGARSVEALQSPETASALNSCPLGYAASEPVPSTAATCPMGYGDQSATTNERNDGAEAGPAPAQCPMGFSAADGPRMTQLHCVICKSLLYDCVQLSCSCKYCRYCVANFSDCPLCGADITSRTPAPELQGSCNVL